jgi:hypothetical protein
VTDPVPDKFSPDPAATTPAAKIFAKAGDLDDFLRGLDRLSSGIGQAVGLGTGGLLPPRVNADPHNVEKGLARLVLTLIELLRQLMERQAIRRMEGGSLTDEEIERLGTTFMLLQGRMGELKKSFGLEDADLNIDLGPLGKLL